MTAAPETDGGAAVPPSDTPPSPYTSTAAAQAEVLAAFREGVATGRREAHYDAERRVSEARAQGWRDGREFDRDTAANPVSTARVLALLVLAFMFGYFVLGPFITSAIDKREDRPR